MTIDGLTDVDSFAVREPTIDGFRYYFGHVHDRPVEELLVDRARLLTLSAPEMTVLVVDPQLSTIRCYRSPEQVAVFSRGMLDPSDVLPGFQLDVCEVFA
ncbi:MAG: hypothetical protein FJ276_25575 [Planctomycetes bacterium]|nr:hypothetical protein [Planctomycetota bacterium]